MCPHHPSCLHVVDTHGVHGGGGWYTLCALVGVEQDEGVDCGSCPPRGGKDEGVFVQPRRCQPPCARELVRARINRKASRPRERFPHHGTKWCPRSEIVCVGRNEGTHPRVFRYYCLVYEVTGSRPPQATRKPRYSKWPVQNSLLAQLEFSPGWNRKASRR